MCLSDTRTERVVLPDTVLPSHYKLHLTPDLDRQTYQGTVAISVTVAHETDTYVVEHLRKSLKMKHPESVHGC